MNLKNFFLILICLLNLFIKSAEVKNIKLPKYQKVCFELREDIEKNRNKIKKLEGKEESFAEHPIDLFNEIDENNKYALIAYSFNNILTQNEIAHIINSNDIKCYKIHFFKELEIPEEAESLYS